MKSKSDKHEHFEQHGHAAKPISFHPLKVDAAVAALLKVKPEPKK
jgi:hypothetical protein